jgi:hypothetical protein
MPTPEEDQTQRRKVAAVLRKFRRDAERDADSAAEREERSAEIKELGYFHWLKSLWQRRSAARRK